MAQDFPLILAFTLKEEGGFTDTLGDGQITNKGITLTTLIAWRHAKDEPTPTVEDLRTISTDELTALYASEFFNPLRCHDLPPGIDLMTFDFAVNVGPKRAAVLLQRAVGLTGAEVDGWIGPRTIAAAHKADPLTLLADIAYRQQTFYFAEAQYVTFGKGWMTRTNRRLLAAWDMSRAATPQPIPLPAPVAAA